MKTKQPKTELEIFLRKRAKELKSDWADVPMWLIEASNEFIQKTKQTPREKMIERASHLLSDGDISTAEMIEAIDKHKDENEIIDYVEGVVVWEKVEFSFTCEQFLSEIGFTKDFYNK